MLNRVYIVTCMNILARDHLMITLYLWLLVSKELSIVLDGVVASLWLVNVVLEFI